MSETIKVTELDKIESMQSGDCLLLVRTADDGTQKAYRIAGSQFNGQDAYDVAVAAGYTGTRDEWEAQVTAVADFSIKYDADSGSIVFTR